MGAAGRYAFPHLAARLLAELALLEKTAILHPGRSHDDPQSALLGQVQEPARRYRVGQERVEARVPHEREVAGHGGWLRELMTLTIRRKRAVRRALHEELLGSEVEELAFHPWPRHEGSLVDGESAVDDLFGGKLAAPLPLLDARPRR